MSQSEEEHTDPGATADDLEPEEFDPTSLGPDPPEVPDLSEKATDADPDVRLLFWWLVLVFDAALLAFSLGLMFIAFEGKWALGSQLTVAGLVLGGYGYLRYRRFDRS